MTGYCQFCEDNGTVELVGYEVAGVTMYAKVGVHVCPKHATWLVKMSEKGSMYHVITDALANQG